MFAIVSFLSLRYKISYKLKNLQAKNEYNIFERSKKLLMTNIENQLKENIHVI